MLIRTLLAQIDAGFNAWLDAERGRFLLFLPVFMAGGVIAYFARSTEPLGWPAGLFVAVTAAAAIWARGRAVALAVLLCMVFAAGGFACARFAAWRAPPWTVLPRTAMVLQGRISQIDILPEGRRVTLSARSLAEPLPALVGGAASPELAPDLLGRVVRIRLRASDSLALTPGDVMAVRAMLRAPSAPSYPGGWDMQRDAFFDGMAGYGFALGGTRLVSKAPYGAWRGLREAVAGRIMAGLPGERGAIAATLLTGMGASIPAEDRAAFQASGLAHLLAVAGLHIGIVMGLVFFVMQRSLAASEYTALYWPAKRMAAVGALLAGGFYLALTGAHVPILRSFAMASLVTLAALTGRRAISARALALAAVGLMLVSPQEVMGVSFQMSFAAVMALVAGWEALRPVLAGVGQGLWWRRPALAILGLAMTSALAGTASLPFAAYHFGNATLWYVPANMVAVPVTAFWVMPFGLLALLLMPFGLAWVALVPMGWGIGVLLFLARGVAAWPSALTPVPQIPPSALLWMAGGLCWLCLWRTRWRLAGIAPMLAGALLMFTQHLPDLVESADGRLIAARVGGAVFTAERPGAGSFERESPGRVWGVSQTQAFPATGIAAGGAVQCDTTSCRLRFGPYQTLLLRDAEASCAGADAAVAAVTLSACDAPLVVDRRRVGRDGAIAITFGPRGPATLSDHDVRGDRPWVIRAAAALPPALTE